VAVRIFELIFELLFRVASWDFVNRSPGPGNAIHEVTRRITKYRRHLLCFLSFMNERNRLPAFTFCLLILTATAAAQSRATRLAVVDFGKDPAGLRAAAAVRETLHPKAEEREFTVVDRDQTSAAAIGAGFAGSLNLTIQQARDIGSAMDCDFYFIGEAQTLRRSPSTKPVYYESYATVFLVSARTGRLILWERPMVQRDAPEESEKALLAILSAAETRQRYFVLMRHTQEDERAERVTAIGSAALSSSETAIS